VEDEWIIGHPPTNKDVCWLAVRGCVIERGETEVKVLLAVHDGQWWCESVCWRGISCLEAIDDEIIAYKNYQVPEPPVLNKSCPERTWKDINFF